MVNREEVDAPKAVSDAGKKDGNVDHRNDAVATTTATIMEPRTEQNRTDKEKSG